VPQLAIPKRIDLTWHVVCGRYELEELSQAGLLKPWKPAKRYDLFEKIKHPNQSFWQGTWGPERLYYDLEDNMTTGQLGRVFCTDQRYEEIRKWFLDHMFEANIKP